MQSRAFCVCGARTGELLIELLRREEIETWPIFAERATRESYTVREESSGNQYRFNFPGPELTERHWQDGLEMLGRSVGEGDFVVASGSLPPGVPEDFYARVAETVRARGGRCVVDTSGPALSRAAEAGVYLLKPNMHELAQLAGEEIQDEQMQERTACRIINEGKGSVVVVSLGSAGVLMVTKEKSSRFRAPSVPIRGRVGAGDSTVAGIVLGLHRGYSVKEAVQLGIAAGAAAVMTPGSELCRREDTERLFEALRGESSSVESPSVG
jgi:6-phosphofructokinase 2